MAICEWQSCSADELSIDSFSMSGDVTGIEWSYLVWPLPATIRVNSSCVPTLP